MLERIRQKIKSQQGASLSMALLLFLVCTVVASVVIAAATAAAGRQAELEKMDKSYYNVTSAAELFWDELKSDDADARTVTIKRECDMTETGPASRSLTNWTASIDNDTFVTDDSLTNEDATLFQMLAYDMVFGGSTVSGDESFESSRSLDADTIAGSIEQDTLKSKAPQIPSHGFTYDAFAIEASDDSLAQVDVSSKVKPDSGELSLTFAESGNKVSYKCTATATVDIDDVPCARKQTGSNTYHLTWVTKIVWDADALKLGGGKSGA